MVRAPSGPPTKRAQEAKEVSDTTPTPETRTAPKVSAQNEVCCRPESPCPGQCPACGKHWRALGAAHCPNPSCCLHFASDYAFDKHRVDGRCLTPEELRQPKPNGKQILIETDRGWVTERMPEAVVAARASRGEGDDEQ